MRPGPQAGFPATVADASPSGTSTATPLQPAAAEAVRSHVADPHSRQADWPHASPAGTSPGSSLQVCLPWPACSCHWRHGRRGLWVSAGLLLGRHPAAIKLKCGSCCRLAGAVCWSNQALDRGWTCLNALSVTCALSHICSADQGPRDLASAG